MYLVKFLIATYFALAVQLSLQPLFSGRDYAVNLPWLVLLLGCRQESRTKAVVGGALIGLLVDCLMPGRLGIGMFCAAMTAYLFQPTFGRGAHFQWSRYVLFGYWPLLGLEIMPRLVRRAVMGRAVLVGDELVAGLMSSLGTFVMGACLFVAFRLGLATLRRNGILSAAGHRGRE